MALSSDLISQFVKVTNDQSTEKKEQTLCGETVISNGKKFVKLDGSEVLTPVASTADAQDGDRVTVSIKNHSATITGNLSSPAARIGDLDESNTKILEVETLMAYKVTTTDLEALNAYIEVLESKVGSFEELSAQYAEIEELKAKMATFDTVSAKDISAIIGEFEKIKSQIGEFKDLSTEDLKAMSGQIDNLTGYMANFTYISSDRLTAIKANIDDLYAKKLDVESAKIEYANIDFANIGNAAIEEFYAKSGIIKNLVLGESTVVGDLNGIRINGDLINANTIKAEKILLKGDDGLFYRLNTDGKSIITEGINQDETNALNGQIIIGHSVTADKIFVKDLVSFGAKIANFVIKDKAIYSGTKSSPLNTTRGIYLGSNGEMSVGDSTNYIRYYIDNDMQSKLEISAQSIMLSTTNSNIENEITYLHDQITGRNLLFGTKDYLIGTLMSSGCILSDIDDNGYASVSIKLNNIKSENLVMLSTVYANNLLLNDKKIVISFDYKSNNITDYLDKFYLNFSIAGSNDDFVQYNLIPYLTVPFNDASYLTPIEIFQNEDWHRMSYILDLTSISDKPVLSGYKVYRYALSFTTVVSDNDKTSEDESICSLGIRKIKMEIGIKPTDWTAAPEDSDAVYSNLYRSVKDVSNTAGDAYDSSAASLGSISKVIEDYDKLIGREDITSTKSINDRISYLEQTAEGLKSKVSEMTSTFASNEDLDNNYVKNSELNSIITTTIAEQTNAKFSQIYEEIATVGDETRVVTRYFNNEAGTLVLGTSENSIVLKIENSKISFYNGSNQTAYFNTNTMGIDNVIVNRTGQIGNFRFVQKSDGHLSFNHI